MKIKSLSFENYKSFPKNQTIKIKPITVLIGKNSSGKSSIAKIFTLLESSLSGRISEPLHFINNGVELGGEFRDLVYGRQPSSPINFTIEYSNGTTLNVGVIQISGRLDLVILQWAILKPSGEKLSLQFQPDGSYEDEEKNKYLCKFSGFIPTDIRTIDGTINILEKFWIPLNIEVDYIGPFRILPQRQFYLSGQIRYDKTEVRGENAYAQLGISKIQKEQLHENVGTWFKDHFDGWELKVNDSNKPFIQIDLDNGVTSVNIVDVGQGMNQVLPLVVRSHVIRAESIVVLEQPELHLHPAAHGDIMELFAKSAKQGQFFVIETHAENMILRLRSLIVNNDFNLTFDDVIIYSVGDAEGGGQELMEISINENGVLSDWPEGIFGEGIKEILQIQRAIKTKQESKV